MRTLLVSVVTCLCLFVFAVPVFAQRNTIPPRAAQPAQGAAALCDPATGVCNTEVGQVPIDPAGIVIYAQKLAIPIGGAIALLLIIWGGFRIIVSNGSVEEVQKGRETIYYAIIGLVLIIFSVIIIQVIGQGILQVPFFG